MNNIWKFLKENKEEAIKIVSRFLLMIGKSERLSVTLYRLPRTMFIN